MLLEGLDDPAAGPRLLGSGHGVWLAFGREHHDRQMAAGDLGGQAVEHVEAAHAWHVDVADHERQVGLGPDLCGAVDAVRCLDHLVAGAAEGAGDLAAHRGRVVDDQYLLGHDDFLFYRSQNSTRSPSFARGSSLALASKLKSGAIITSR